VIIDRIPEEKIVAEGIYIDFVEELEVELAPRHLGAADELDEDEHHDAENAEGAERHEVMKAAVSHSGIAARKQEYSDCRWRIFLCLSRIFPCRTGGFRLGHGL